jgi:hypothetical protein
MEPTDVWKKEKDIEDVYKNGEEKVVRKDCRGTAEGRRRTLRTYIRMVRRR